MSKPSAGIPTVAPHVKWLILIIASIGFAFDTYELLMLPLVLGPAMKEMYGITPASDDFKFYFSLLFYVPALAGGIFGLWGGWLTDRFGRRFVLTWSILLYAFAAFFAGFSTNVWMLLFFRSLCFIGVCVEFVAAVAWLAELFPDPKEREKAIGWTQAFSSVGGLMVAQANYLSVYFADQLPSIGIPGFWEVQDGHSPWRYTLMSGLIPALPLILIRPFLPESPVWAQKKEAGTLKRPSIAALFAPELRRTTIATAIGFACTLGIAFGSIQQMPQIIPGLKEVSEKATAVGDKAAAALTEKGETDPKKIGAEKARASGLYRQKMASEYTKMQEIGGLVGRILMAIVLIRVIHWGWSLRMFQIGNLILTPLLFYFFVRAENTTYFEIPLDFMLLGTLPVTTMSIGIFLVGLFTVSQLSFWGNYLPHMYPVHLRGTGESFAANIGGRMIGTTAAAVTMGVAYLISSSFKDGPTQISTAAAIVGASVCVVAIIASFWLPEPSGKFDDH